MNPARPAVLLAVAVGGALGGALRWWLGDMAPDGDGFPWTTFAINVTGSLALALLPAISIVRSPSGPSRPRLGPGAGRLHHLVDVRRARTRPAR